jgi:hypothetical protein
MQNLVAVYSALYKAEPQPFDPLTIHYTPAIPIPDNPPSEAEIIDSVKKLRSGKAPGPSGLLVDDIKQWDTTREEDPEPWNRFVELVTHCFSAKEVPQALCFSTLVLIPKASGGVRGIGLLELVWKYISMIIKERLQSHIIFDDMLHGF